jgi:hypothetical protein
METVSLLIVELRSNVYRCNLRHLYQNHVNRAKEEYESRIIIVLRLKLIVPIYQKQDKSGIYSEG